MAKPFSPFEQTADHDLDHDPAQQQEQSLDPAQRALSDALRVSFGILKWVMVIMVVGYLCSGFFTVSTQERAVRLQFGGFVTNADNTTLIYEPGGPHFAFPYPFEEIIRIPTAPRTVSLNRQFWFQEGSAEAGRTVDELAAQGKRMPLNPEHDGSLLTGDANLVHAKLTVTYEISDPVDYVTNVGTVELADKMVRVAAEQTAVYTAARIEADQFLLSAKMASEVAITHIQDTLTGIGCGITVTGVDVRPEIPVNVVNARQAVLRAENERAQALEAAQQEWSRVLGETAGEAYRPLWQLLQQYEHAVDAEDAELQAELEKQLATAFETLNVDGSPIGGKVSEVINEAKAYRTQVVTRVGSEAEQFKLLLTQYRVMPKIVLNQQWQQTRQEILTGDIETFYMPAGQIYLDLNPDPKVKRAREQERMRHENQQQQQRR